MENIQKKKYNKKNAIIQFQKNTKQKITTKDQNKKNNEKKPQQKVIVKNLNKKP